MNKYRNVKTILDGIQFDSRKEMSYYGMLKIRKQIGEVTDFKMQVPFELWVNGELICKYIADFVEYYPNGKYTVIDVKSAFTRKLPVYSIKRKLMRAVLGIEIIEK